MDETPLFGVELLRLDDRATVVDLEGEVDIHTSRRFEEALSQSIGTGAAHVIIDFAKVTFIDSTALGVVVGGVKGVTARGGTLDIVCPDGNIKRILEATGMDRILGVYPSRAEVPVVAVRGCPPPASRGEGGVLSTA